MVLEEVSLVNEPVVWVTPSTSVVEYVNVLSPVTDSTVKVPLKPTFSVAVVFDVLLTFLSVTLSFTFKL